MSGQLTGCVTTLVQDYDDGNNLKASRGARPHACFIPANAAFGLN